MDLTIFFPVSPSVDGVILGHVALFLCSWVTSLMLKGFKQELKHEDLFATPEESLSRDLHQRFDKLVYSTSRGLTPDYQLISPRT